jgi:polysaccharide biosynthesis protein PslE
MGAVRRHKAAAISCFLIIAVSVSVTLLLWPRSYQSEGKLFVRLGRENATLDPTASVGQEHLAGLSYSSENEVNSVVEVLNSRGLLEKVVDAIGPGEILATGDSWLAPWSRWQSRSEAANQRSRDQAVRQLMRGVKVFAVRKSNIVQVSCVAQSPPMAQKIIAKLIDLYLDEHIRLNRPPETHEFFVKQTDGLRTGLTKAEETLRDLKTSTGLSSPAQQRQVLVSRMARLQDDVAEAEAAEAAARSRVAALGKQLAGLPETRLASHTEGIADEGTNRMREQLYALQLKKEDAAAKYSPEHPVMQQLERQFAAAKQTLDQQATSRPQATTAINHPYEETHLALLREEPLLAGTQAKATALRGQLAAVTRQWKRFNEGELRIAQLDREVELLQTNYHKSATALDQARLDRALELQRMSNISIVQPATLDLKAVSPPLRASLALGVVLAALGGLGLAVLRDNLDQRVREPADIEEKLRIPVLGSVPVFPVREPALAGNGRS